MGDIVMWLIVACIILAVLIIRPVRLIVRLGLSAAIGGLGIYIANILLAPMGLFVSLNVITLAIVTILGLPGFFLLYITSYLL